MTGKVVKIILQPANKNCIVMHIFILYFQNANEKKRQRMHLRSSSWGFVKTDSKSWILDAKARPSLGCILNEASLSCVEHQATTYSTFRRWSGYMIQGRWQSMILKTLFSIWTFSCCSLQFICAFGENAQIRLWLCSGKTMEVENSGSLIPGLI